MSIPETPVDRKRGFLSSLGVESSIFYMLAGLALMVFVLLVVLSWELPKAEPVQPISPEPVPAESRPRTAIGGASSGEPTDE